MHENLKVILLSNNLHCKLRSPTVKAMTTAIITFSYSQLRTTNNYFLYEFIMACISKTIEFNIPGQQNTLFQIPCHLLI